MIGDNLLMQAQYPNLIGNIVGSQTYYEQYTGNTFIAAGMGVKSISTKELIFYGGHRMEQVLKEEQLGYTKRRYEEYKDFITDHINTLPSHYQYLKDNIYNGTDDYAL
jgi:hypothetical protein